MNEDNLEFGVPWIVINSQKEEEKLNKVKSDLLSAPDIGLSVWEMTEIASATNKRQLKKIIDNHIKNKK